MSFTRDVHERFLNGSVLIGQPDTLPDETVRILRNARLDRQIPAISSRPGSTSLASSIAAGTVYSLHKLFSTAADFCYAHINTALYRLTSTWGTATSIATVSTQPVSSADMVDGDGTPHKYFVNGAVIGKEDGTSLTTFGITAPTAAPSASALATDLSTTISAMDDHTLWTGSSVTGKADETNIKIEGTGSVTFTVAIATVGSIGQGGLTLDLDTLTSGNADVKDDDYIHLWFRCDFPERIDFIQLDFDLDTTTLANAFRTNWYSVRLSSLVWLNQGSNQWTQIQVPKSQFERFGTSTAVDWSTVKSVRIVVATNANGAVTVYVDDFKLRGGVDIEGDVEYTAVYRNTSTGGISNPPLDSDDNVLFTTALKGVKRQRVSLTISNIVSGGADHPGDTQIDEIDLYRRINGGQWLKIVNFVDTTASPYIDANLVQDSLLQPVILETDNNLPPSGDILFGPGPFNRLFMIQGQNRVYFSKAWERTYNRVENWPTDWFMVVGEGSHRAMTGIATDTDVFVWTESQTYQVVGGGVDTFLPIPVPNSQGIVSRYAVTSGDGRIFFVAADGIYEQVGQVQRRLTDGIAPFFAGRTVEGQIGLNKTPGAMANIRLEWHADPHAPMLLMLYPEVGSTTANKELSVKKHPVSGQYSVFSFDSHGTPLQSLYEDQQTNTLIGGDTNGNVIQLENHSTSSDLGGTVAFDVITKSYHQGVPLRDKHYEAAILEANTNGTSLTVTAQYDKNSTTEALGAASGSSVVGDFHFSVADALANRHDIGLRLQADTLTQIDVYRIGWLVDVQPEWLRDWDSGLIDLSRVTQMRQLWVDMEADGIVTLTPYFDGTATADILTSGATSGRQILRLPVTAGRKGTIFRLTMTSSSDFRIYRVWIKGKSLQATTGHTIIPVGQGV